MFIPLLTTVAVLSIGYLVWLKKFKLGSVIMTLILVPVFSTVLYGLLRREGYRGCLFYANAVEKQYCRIITGTPKIRGKIAVDFSKINAVEWDRMEISGMYAEVCEYDKNGERYNCRSTDETSYLSFFKGQATTAVIPAAETRFYTKQYNSPKTGKIGAVLEFNKNGASFHDQDK